MTAPALSRVIRAGLNLAPVRLRESAAVAKDFSGLLREQRTSLWIEGLSPAGAQAIRSRILAALLSIPGFPSIRIDPRTDPGAIMEVILNREYDYPGFIPDAGWTVLDIGAQHGEFAVLASHLRGASAIAFEPMPNNFDVIQSNIELNRPNKIIPLRAALGSTSGTISGSTFGGMFIPGVFRFGSPRTRVTVQPLDDMDLGLTRRPESPTLMKIDVEGFEVEVLRGAQRFVRTFGPHIVVEVDETTCPSFLSTLHGIRPYTLVGSRPKPRSTLLFLSPR